MGWLDRLRENFAATGNAWDGTHGAPPSGNGASSFHLYWDAPAFAWVAAEVTIEVIEPPVVPRLYFWALQVSFVDGGQETGGAHIGLQWYPPHPGSTAINWGGYRSGGGGILDGSGSVLPSAVDNSNTRDFAWQPHRRYRTRVEVVPDGGPNGLSAFRGTVTDVESGATTHIRDLWAPGDRLARPMVWSEVFAHCDEPAAAIRWTDLALTDAAGRRTAVDTVSVNYQPVRDGGCARTDVVVSADGRGFEQHTATDRTTPQGARLQLSL